MEVYILKISVWWEIGIGVILYEKGKGKFVGDWKTHHTEIINKLKEKTLSSFYAAKLSN